MSQDHHVRIDQSEGIDHNLAEGKKKKVIRLHKINLLFTVRCVYTDRTITSVAVCVMNL